MTSSLPVWVGDRQRWVTGLGRKTTCEEVIAVLLSGEGCSAEGQCYTIMERWRRMERPLDPRAKILKVWRAWGDTQNEVKLTLRRIDGEADSGRGSPSHSSTHRRRRHRSKPPWTSHETIHPRRLAQLHDATDGRKIPDSIQQLMKLILAQGETIQSQLRRLQDREHQIEHFEDETHRARVEILGSNYLLETYLGGGKLAVEVEEEKENDSGVLTGESDQTSPVSSGERCSKDDNDDGNFADESDVTTKDLDLRTFDDSAVQELQARIEVWEKLAKVNRRLEREEENLVRIHKKIQRYHKKLEAKGDLKLLPDERLDAESYRMRDALLRDLEQVRVDLERGTRELEHNSLALAESESLLDARHHYLRRLQAEVEATDRETQRLQDIVSVHLSRAPLVGPDLRGPDSAVNVPKGILKKTGHTITTVAVIHNDTDSNSDTGLSSLHSSSEEGVYTLDTLV